MQINEHQTETSRHATYPTREPPGSGNVQDLYYPVALLSEEAGEALSIINKAFRKGSYHLTIKEILSLRKELGDCYWALGNILYMLNAFPTDILQENADKLADRASRGTIIGEGDDR